MDVLAYVRFETPGYLALLAVVPLLIALSFRSLAGLGTEGDASWRSRSAAWSSW